MSAGGFSHSRDPARASNAANVRDFPISNYFPSQPCKEKMQSHHRTVMARPLPAPVPDTGGGNLARGKGFVRVVSKAENVLNGDENGQQNGVCI